MSAGLPELAYKAPAPTSPTYIIQNAPALAHLDQIDQARWNRGASQATPPSRVCGLLGWHAIAVRLASPMFRAAGAASKP